MVAENIIVARIIGIKALRVLLWGYSPRDPTGDNGLQDWHFFVVHTNLEYGASNSFFELALKELILGNCFKVVEREFHWFGPMYLRHR